MAQVNMLEAKTNLSRLVEAVETGKESEIVLARNGKPVAKLVPIGARPRRPIGRYDGMYPDISLDDFNAADEEIARMLEGNPADPGPAGSRRKRKT